MMNVIANPDFESGDVAPWVLRAVGGCHGEFYAAVDNTGYVGVVNCTEWLPSPAYINVMQIIGRDKVEMDGPGYVYRLLYRSDVKVALRIYATRSIDGSNFHVVNRQFPASAGMVEAKVDVGPLPSVDPRDGDPIDYFKAIVNPRGVGTLVFDDVVLEAQEAPPNGPPPQPPKPTLRKILEATARYVAPVAVGLLLLPKKR